MSTLATQLFEAAVAEAEAIRQMASEAIEAASGAPAVAAAYEQGRRDERARVLALLAHQQETLGRSGVNAISLATLSRMLREGP